MAADPWAEFQQAPAVDPWAEFAPAPHVGMGDVQAAPSAQVPPEPGFLKKAASFAWNMVKPGQYPQGAPNIPRNPGEDQKSYLARQLHADMAWRASPEGIGNAVRMVGYTLPGGSAPSRSLLTKSTAAQRLEAQGVKGLTVGQMAPESTLGQIEAVSTHNPLGMKDAREAAKDAWRLSEIRKAVNPADKNPLPRDVQAAMEDAYQRFGPEYDAIRQQPVPGPAIAGMPQAAVATPGGIDARTMAGARKEIENALTVLPQPPKPPAPSGLLGPNGQPLPAPPAPPPPNMTAGDLMKVRSVIRDEMRTARQAQDFDRLNQLGHAHDIVTRTLEQNLPPDAVKSLGDIDRRYSTLMTLEHASPAGQTNFAPNQMLRSAEHSSGRRAFKQGNANLQDSGEAAREVFTDAPMTGFRGAVLGSVPGMHYAAAPIARLANTEAGKRLLFDTPLVPTGLPRPPAQTSAPLLAQTLRRLGLVEPIPTPAQGDQR